MSDPQPTDGMVSVADLPAVLESYENGSRRWWSLAAITLLAGVFALLHRPPPEPNGWLAATASGAVCAFSLAAITLLAGVFALLHRPPPEPNGWLAATASGAVCAFSLAAVAVIAAGKLGWYMPNLRRQLARLDK